MCDEAAACPAGERPPLRTITGFLAAARRRAAEEAPAVAYSLHVCGDHTGVRILGEVVQEVRLVEVERVPVADHLAEPQTPLLPAPDHAKTVASALGQEADVTRLGWKARIEGELCLRVVEPHAVGADHADARLLDATLQLPLERRRFITPGFAEASREEVDQLRSLGLGSLHQLQRGAGGNRGDHEVHRPRDGLEPRVGLVSQQLIQLGVDRMDRAREADLDQRLDELVSLALRIRGGAHDGDALRPEEGLEAIVGCGLRAGGLVPIRRYPVVFVSPWENRDPRSRLSSHQLRTAWTRIVGLRRAGH